MIKINNISKSFSSGVLQKREIHVFKNASLIINKGEIIGLIGSSGSGKSTLGKLILGLEKPDSGKILFYKKNIYQLKNSEKKLYYSQVQIVPQYPDMAFNPKLRIKTSINELFKFYDICPYEKQSQYLKATLEHVKLLPSVLDRFPYQLSGGEIQRLAIARAILLKPSFLILDEVTSMLDLSIQAQIIQVLNNIHKSHKTSYLFITHNIPLARKFCQKIFMINNGILKKN